MFVSNVSRREEVREGAVRHLKEHGIKYKPKKRPPQQVVAYKNRIFGVPLGQLKTEIVTLANGQQLVVPKIVCDMTQFIVKTDPEREGMFRLSGRMEHMNKLKNDVDRGLPIPTDENVIHVASLLKKFFIDLPETLIPITFHELFIHCMDAKKKLESVLLACLLLPSEHINTLACFMAFLHEVTKFSQFNKMTPYNIAVCVTPSITKIDDKVTLAIMINLVEMLIINAGSVGIIPEDIINEIGQLHSENPKKRRSSSLTRMFSGLRKIVGKGDSGPDNMALNRVITPDLLLTPSINRTGERGRSKKRRSDFSAKKKKEVVDRLPEARLLSTPYTPSRTPISANPNPKNKVLSSHYSLEDIIHRDTEKEKKSIWYSKSRSVKNLKTEDTNDFKEKRRNSLGPKAMLERRWSQVSQVTNFRKKKRNSCVGLNTKKVEKKKADGSLQSMDKLPEPDYVRVSKEEYEEIKNRVTQIERRISMELDTVHCEVSENDNNSNVQAVKNIENVMTAYEQTLEQSEPMSPTTDNLARRLSRELRIRKNSEAKVIRSPSARKIGSIRRRSKERERQVTKKVARHQSWHVQHTMMIPRAHLVKAVCKTQEQPQNANRPVTRSTSFQGTFQTPPRGDNSALSQNSCDTSGSNTQWMSAECFFSTLKTPNSTNGSANGRASIAKIRAQNAGMVLAKAKLFDNLRDSDSSSGGTSKSKTGNQSKSSTTKIGSSRTAEARMSQRVRNLRMEERKARKKSTSPRKQKNRIYMSKEQVEVEYKKSLEAKSFVTPIKEQNRIAAGHLLNSPKCTPRSIPHIKKNLNVRSPKRLCKTPKSVEKRTPLKVLAKPRCEF